MNAGILNKRITIRKKTSTRNASGEEVILWSEFAIVWASVEPLRGQEYLEANRLQADIDVRFRIRFLAGVKPSMQVRYDDRDFNITSVIHVKEGQTEMQLMCKELVEESA